MIGSNRPIARDTARSVEPGGTPKLARSPRRTRMNWRHRTAVEQRPGWGAALNAVAFISQLCPSSPKGAPQARTTHSFCVAWPAAQAICWQTTTQISERRWALMAKRTRRAGTTAGAAEVMQLPAVFLDHSHHGVGHGGPFELMRAVDDWGCQQLQVPRGAARGLRLSLRRPGPSPGHLAPPRLWPPAALPLVLDRSGLLYNGQACWLARGRNSRRRQWTIAAGATSALGG